jgi:plasmid stabilization system protein ParE
MAGKPVILHPEAEREYLTSLEWYLQRSPTAAANFADEIERAIEMIVQTPERWPAYYTVCKRYVLRQFPFSIIYRVFPSRVFVLAVAHGHRRPGYWRKRMRWQGPE